MNGAYVDLRTLHGRDAKYLLPQVVEGTNGITTHKTRQETGLEGLPVMSRDVPTKKMIIVGGTPIFDVTFGVVRYQIRLTKGSSEHKLSHYGITPFQNLQHALMAENDLTRALTGVNLPADVIINIVPFGESCYAVSAEIIPDAKSDEPEIRRKLAQIVSQLSQ